MEDKLIHKRVRKGRRQGMICNYVEVTVSWDNGGCTREKIKDLEFIENEKEGYKNGKS